jgi:Flp pilus assembly protein TadD
VITTVRRVQYAIGYIQLRLFAEAAEELDAISPADLDRPEVLAARVELFREAGEWSQVVPFARRLLERDASDVGAWVSLGCAVRRVESVSAARDTLLVAEERLGPGHAIIHYNLACYHCLLGEGAEARRRLAEACRLDAEYAKLAQEDPDLLAINAPG